MTILHAGENFLLAELPALENGARQLLSKSGETVMVHVLEQGMPTSSRILDIPFLRAVLAALDSAPQA